MRRARRSRIAGVTPWSDALARESHAGPADDGPGRSVRHPVQLRHDRSAEGLHAHASQRDAHAGRELACGSTRTRISSQLVVLPFFHVTSMQGGMNAPIYQGSTIVLMCRWDRDVAAELIQRYRLIVVDRDLDDGHRLPRQPAPGRIRPVVAAAHVRRRRGDAGSGRRATAAADRLAVHRRLRTHRDDRADAHQSARARRSGSAWASRSSIPTRASSIPKRCKELPQGRSARSSRTVRRSSSGYWRNEAATRAAFIELDGKRFFRTGDLGYVDEDGYFFLVDRLKRMINASGYKVWPAEVEAQMYQHPAIQEACVIAAKDAHRGETVKAVVVLRPAHKGKVTRERDHRMDAPEHGDLQASARDRVRRCVAEVGDRQGAVARCCRKRSWRAP